MIWINVSHRSLAKYQFAEHLHRGLPFFGIVFCLRQFSDVSRGVRSVTS